MHGRGLQGRTSSGATRLRNSSGGSGHVWAGFSCVVVGPVVRKIHSRIHDAAGAPSMTGRLLFGMCDSPLVGHRARFSMPDGVRCKASSRISCPPPPPGSVAGLRARAVVELRRGCGGSAPCLFQTPFHRSGDGRPTHAARATQFGAPSGPITGRHARDSPAARAVSHSGVARANTKEHAGHPRDVERRGRITTRT